MAGSLAAGIIKDKASASARLHTALAEAVFKAKAPGAVAYVGDLCETYFHEAFGERELEPEKLPANTGTLYDLASVTKVVATTTAVLLLREQGLINLDQPASRYVPIPAFGRFTVRQLLTHMSGLVSGKPFYKEVTSLDEMLARHAALDLESVPGTRWRYSDVGFMIVGKIVELVSQDSLDAFCRKRIFMPLGMKHTGFKPPAEWVKDCAATERCPWRGCVMIGAVHDENAYAVGGVSGHAGLFSTAEDLARFCRGMLGGKVLKATTVSEMTRLGQVSFHPSQGLGWWLDSWTIDPWSGNSLGFLPVRTAFGMSGWTGTSIWMDRESGLFAILLGNTCHPLRADRDNDSFRRTFHMGVAQSAFGDRFAAHSGLDRLLYVDFAPLRNKRVALLTHRAAVDQFGRHILDVFGLSRDVRLQRIYSPEHGLWGTAEAGEKVGAQTAPAPVVSLYGERLAPTPNELHGIDYFVVDMQDVGARYYTYLYTMKSCLAACAEAGKPVLVLDRPNPLGGEVLEGPIAVNTNASVCCAPIPIRHGMTLGETAEYFQQNEFRHLQLHILDSDGWSRARLFGDTALPWVPPSPNIPTPETALLYVGMCLFEGVNLNEGRGTETPFQLIGAPWLEARKVIRALRREETTGCRLEATKYTPQSIPGKAASPVFMGQPCQGIRVTVTNPRDVRTFTLATALLAAIRRRHPREFEWKRSFDVLAGGDDLRRRIEQGQTATEIVAAYEPALRAFAAARPRRYS